MLKKTLLDRDIEVREGWELLDIEEKKDSVTAYFNHERVVTASFLIGCDGIKSASRSALLRSKGIAEGLPSYTGLTQVTMFSFSLSLSPFSRHCSTKLAFHRRLESPKCPIRYSLPQPCAIGTVTELMSLLTPSPRHTYRGR